MRVAWQTRDARLRVCGFAAFVASLLVAAAGSMFPYLLPGYPLGHGGISIFDAAPSPVALGCALTVTIGGGVAVVCLRNVVASRWRARFTSNSRRLPWRSTLTAALARYDRSRLALCSIGSHSALEVAFGARAQGLHNLVVTAKGRERTYAQYYRAPRGDRSPRGCVDAVLELDSFPDILRDDVQERMLAAKRDLRRQSFVRSLSAPELRLRRNRARHARSVLWKSLTYCGPKSATKPAINTR